MNKIFSFFNIKNVFKRYVYKKVSYLKIKDKQL